MLPVKHYSDCLFIMAMLPPPTCPIGPNDGHPVTLFNHQVHILEQQPVIVPMSEALNRSHLCRATVGTAVNTSTISTAQTQLDQGATEPGKEQAACSQILLLEQIPTPWLGVWCLQQGSGQPVVHKWLFRVTASCKDLLTAV
jgi:hypothetical protein